MYVAAETAGDHCEAVKSIVVQESTDEIDHNGLTTVFMRGALVTLTLLA